MLGGGGERGTGGGGGEERGDGGTGGGGNLVKAMCLSPGDVKIMMFPATEETHATT